MHLKDHAPTNWLDVVAMRVEGVVSSWVNATLQDVVAGHRLVGPIQGSHGAAI